MTTVHRTKFIILLLMGLCFGMNLQAQSIEDKKAGLIGMGSDLDAESQALLDEINGQLTTNRARLDQLQADARRMHEQGAPADHFPPVLKEIRHLRQSNRQLLEQWRARLQGIGKEESYALWQQPETTLDELVSDYGSQDHIYVIPQEVANIRVSVNSNLPVPRESWGELLELILAQNGVGVRQLNTFLRELFLLKDDPGVVQLISSKRSDLAMLPSHVRACFVLKPEFESPARIYQILERFSRSSLASLHQIAGDIYIVGRSDDIQDVLKIYDFVRQNHQDKQYKLVTLSNGTAEDMAEILELMFHGSQKGSSDSDDGSLSTQSSEEDSSLKVLTLKNAGQTLFLLGSSKQIERAQAVIDELDDKMGEAREKTIFYYVCRYSEAEEVARVLDKVYRLMISEPLEGDEGQPATSPSAEADLSTVASQEEITDSYYDAGMSIVIDPSRVDPRKEPESPKTDNNRRNFIVDPKTGSIVMVVEPEHLPRIKDLLKKLDVPKKMVQLDVIIFEKTYKDSTEYGLNLLAFGKQASGGAAKTGSVFDARSSGNTAGGIGIMNFVYSAAKSRAFSAVDIAYRFLTSQSDVQINANPSVTTVNQTQAEVMVQTETSISTGTSTDQDTNTRDETFVRQQFGITVRITPTIHDIDPEAECSVCEDRLVTLETEIFFDTPEPSTANTTRPDLVRRAIKNEVRIADGQSLILGGLRRKDMTDQKQGVPGLGELPGFGKLFSHNEMVDETRELFVLITPTVIVDQYEDVCRIKRRELMRRPGDSIEFVERLESAVEDEKRCRVVGAMKMVMGRCEESCYDDDWSEYDGC